MRSSRTKLVAISIVSKYLRSRGVSGVDQMGPEDKMHNLLTELYTELRQRSSSARMGFGRPGLIRQPSTALLPTEIRKDDMRLIQGSSTIIAHLPPKKIKNPSEMLNKLMLVCSDGDYELRYNHPVTSAFQRLISDSVKSGHIDMVKKALGHKNSFIRAIAYSSLRKHPELAEQTEKESQIISKMLQGKEGRQGEEGRDIGMALEAISGSPKLVEANLGTLVELFNHPQWRLAAADVIAKYPEIVEQNAQIFNDLLKGNTVLTEAGLRAISRSRRLVSTNRGLLLKNLGEDSSDVGWEIVNVMDKHPQLLRKNAADLLKILEQNRKEFKWRAATLIVRHNLGKGQTERLFGIFDEMLNGRNYYKERALWAMEKNPELVEQHSAQIIDLFKGEDRDLGEHVASLIARNRRLSEKFKESLVKIIKSNPRSELRARALMAISGNPELLRTNQKLILRVMRKDPRLVRPAARALASDPESLNELIKNKPKFVKGLEIGVLNTMLIRLQEMRKRDAHRTSTRRALKSLREHMLRSI